jgi:hypothetical protein
MILNSTYAAAENISTRLPGLISVLTVKSLSAASSFLSDILGILDRNEQFKEINNQIRDYCKTYLDSTCTNEINQEGQNEKQTYKPMCSGISQSSLSHL